MVHMREKHGLWRGVLALVSALMLVCTGCRFSIGGSSYGNYSHASKYEIGNFDYEAAGIQAVEVNWVSGNIVVAQSSSDTLHVEECGKGLKDAQRVHWLIDGSKLFVQYCESDYRGNISSKDKQLRIEVPKGVAIAINSVSGDVALVESQSFDALDIEAVSGNVVAEDVSLQDKGEITTVSGDIVVGLAAAKKLEVESVSGNVELIALPDDGAVITFESVSGDANADGWPKDDDELIVGEGACKVSVQTVSGNLVVR